MNKPNLSFHSRLIYLANTLWWTSFDPICVCCALSLWSAIWTDYKQVAESSTSGRKHTQMSASLSDVRTLNMLIYELFWSWDCLLTSSMMMVLIYAPSPPVSYRQSCRDLCLPMLIHEPPNLIIMYLHGILILFLSLLIFKVHNLELIIPERSGRTVWRRRTVFMSHV